jgi:polysaccharide chain length determinant protein (PEP-CTERM system associated)
MNALVSLLRGQISQLQDQISELGDSQLRDKISGTWRFRWVALATAAALALVGWLIVFGMPDRYEADTSVFVDTRTSLTPALQGLTTEQDVDPELNRVRQSLLARPSLQRIAREGGVLPEWMREPQRAKLLAAMSQRIDISVRSANGHEEDRRTAGSIYHMAYQDHDRARSLRVVQILLNTLVSETLGGKREGSENAQQFLQTQIADYEKRLRAAEDRLADFKTRHFGLMPTEQGGYFTQLQRESEATGNVRIKLVQAQARRAALTRQLHGDLAVATAAPGQTGGTVGSRGGLDTLSRIDEAQARLDDLLLIYTGAHPDVTAARQTLADLKKRRAAEIESLRRGDPDAAAASRASSNPVYQSLLLALNQVNVDIADLNTELAEHESKAAELRRQLDTAPQVEAEYAQLNRDYDVNKAQYTALLAGLQKARLGERADSAGSVRFQIVQPPSATYEPVWPRRKLLMLGVLIAALAAGGAVAYGLNYLLPVVSSASALSRAVGVPVLGEVSVAFPESVRLAFRRDLQQLSVATGCLLLAFGVALVLSQAGYRLSLTALKHLVYA